MAFLEGNEQMEDNTAFLLSEMVLLALGPAGHVHQPSQQPAWDRDEEPFSSGHGCSRMVADYNWWVNDLSLSPTPHITWLRWASKAG